MIEENNLVEELEDVLEEAVSTEAGKPFTPMRN